MKKKLLAGLIALSLLLSGCSGLLNRSYTHITTHNAAPASEGDPSVLRAENYQELVNALIYFISQGMETGSVRLYVDPEAVDANLESACLEVVQEDPLGAYAVEHIKYTISPVMAYYQADVEITYRRTREQIGSIVLATGTTAIRSELESAFSNFSPERVLRISYFHEDETFIQALCQQAYFANPATALDMPEISVTLYPGSGRQRIVEITLAYHLEMQELTRRRELLFLACQELIRNLPPVSDDRLISSAGQAVLAPGGYRPMGGSTAYHALLDAGANSQGLALAMIMVCNGLNIDSHLVEGTLNNLPHFWVVVSTQTGWMHLDLSRTENWTEPFLTDIQMTENGYLWNSEAVPQCGPLPDGDALQNTLARKLP